MKAIILFLFFGLTLSYNPSNALYYASQHCSASSYNPSYNNYKGRGGDCANFVSQCLMAGGLDISNCYGRDDKGSITSVGNLKSCLTQKGWRSSSTKPANFQAGYVLFLKMVIMLFLPHMLVEILLESMHIQMIVVMKM